MAKKSSKARRTISNVEGAYFEGNIQTTNGDVIGRDQMKIQSGLSEDLFKDVFIAIQNKSDLDEVEKQDLAAEVEEVQKETKKGEQADETVLQRRLRTIKRIAPDILEVVLAALTNPAAGIAVTIRKIAERMRAGAT
jgi:hypothetical protein